MLEQIPLFAMLKAKAGYDSQRQRVVAQNVANADTPGYAPKDLKDFSFDKAMGMTGVGPVLTNAMHIAGRPARSPSLNPVTKPDTEARLDGNQVVVEDQMMKLNDTNMDFQTALTFYTQSLTLLRTAAKAPGK